MAYLAVDKDGTEVIFRLKPIRYRDSMWFYDNINDCGFDGLEGCVNLPKGTIKKIIGKNITWDNEPVLLK